MKNPAREKFLPMLSPYVDGELTPEERLQVEQHLANNKESAGQVADFRASDGLMRAAFDMAADDVDWKEFTNQVMSKVTPDKLPLLQRLKVALSELFTYQRGTMVAAMAGAAVAVAVAVPVAIKLGVGSPDGYANSRVEVQTVSSEAGSRPEVMDTPSGDSVIWVIPDKPDAGKKKKKDGKDEEEIVNEPQPDKSEL